MLMRRKDYEGVSVSRSYCVRYLISFQLSLGVSLCVWIAMYIHEQTHGTKYATMRSFQKREREDGKEGKRVVEQSKKGEGNHKENKRTYHAMKIVE